MAVLAQTILGAIGEIAKVTASSSDTFTYNKGTGQVLEINNITAGTLTVVIKGSAPSANYPVNGPDVTVDLTAGKTVSVAAGKVFGVPLDSIAPYLAGTGTVTVTGATGAILTLVVG